MKVTIYTVADCQFSKAEKEYLAAHSVQFEEKNLETNKEFLTEMLAVSNNFAGTPVTKVEKDDGQIAILKGYTKEEFDKALGYSQPKETVVNSAVNIPPARQASDSVAGGPKAPPSPTPTPAPTSPPPIPNTPPSSTPQSPSSDTSDALTSVLENLQSKSSSEPAAPPTIPSPPTSAPTTNPAPTSNPSNPPAGGLPNIPEPDFK